MSRIAIEHVAGKLRVDIFADEVFEAGRVVLFMEGSEAMTLSRQLAKHALQLKPSGPRPMAPITAEAPLAAEDLV